MLHSLIRMSVLAALVSSLWAQDADHPPRKEVLPAPVGSLVAVARFGIPNDEVPEKEDFDSTLVVIKDADNRVIAKHLFSARFITKMLWSPDGKFLALCSTSSGGHSPWHMNSYFWSRSDKRFRSVDHGAGLVVSDSFSFTAPHTLTVQVAPWRDGMWDSEHPLEKQVDLEEIRRATPPLRGDANT
jgi:hypothetical protein